MLYQEHTISNHSGAISRLADFASAIGWTVADISPLDGTATMKTLVAPTSAFHPSPKTWSIGSVDLLTGSPGILAYLDAASSGGVTTSTNGMVKLDAPFNSTLSAKLSPSKVSLFGGVTPDYWIAMVLTYEYNLYRHLYVGHIEPIGGFTGGELLSSSQPHAPVSGSWFVDNPLHSYLFKARTSGTAHSDRYGGLHVVHANAAAEWNKFNATTGFSRDDAHPPGLACGGYTDGFNDGYAQRARNQYAGATILVPQNLYITDNANGFVPVGRAAGVRLVDMINLAPEQSISVGDVPWRVFPAWSRNPSRTHSIQSGVRSESSQYIGYAYMENPD